MLNQSWWNTDFPFSDSFNVNKSESILHCTGFVFSYYT